MTLTEIKQCLRKTNFRDIITFIELVLDGNNYNVILLTLSGGGEALSTKSYILLPKLNKVRL